MTITALQREGKKQESGIRVVYLGLLGAFSVPPLRALLAAGIEVCAVVVPAGAPTAPPIEPVPPARTAHQLPLRSPAPPQTILHLAAEHDVPAFAVNEMAAPDVRAAFRAWQADVACVACFDRKVPAGVLSLPPHGFLNVHPSLLPAYRGPHPLFWTFRDGVTETGVTVHVMDEGLDTGPIARQAPLTLPAGISGPEAERLAAELGGELLVDAVQMLARGTLESHPQPVGGSHHPAPTAADFTLDTRWPARRAFIFMRGTPHWGHPYTVDVAGDRLHLKTALAYEPDRTLPTPYHHDENNVWLQFTPGVLRATLSS